MVSSTTGFSSSSAVDAAAVARGETQPLLSAAAAAAPRARFGTDDTIVVAASSGPDADTDVTAPPQKHHHHHRQGSITTTATTTSATNPGHWLGLRPAPSLLLPAIFVHVLAMTMAAAPLSQFLILIVCQMLPPADTAPSPPPSVINATTAAIVDIASTTIWPDYKLCAARPDVQQTTARWSQLINLATAIPAFLTTPFIGVLVDSFGRRLCLLIPLASSMLGMLTVILIASCNLSPWLLVFTHVLQGFAGGYAVWVTCVYAYLADTTDSASRTEKFLLNDAFTFSAFTIGPFLGGTVYRSIGILPVFYVTFVMDVLVVLYVVFILPESLRKKKQSPEPSIPSQSSEHNEQQQPTSNLKSAEALLLKFRTTWFAVLDVLAAPGRGASVRNLAIVTATAALVVAGYPYIFNFYTAKRFGWDSYDQGLFSLANSVCRLFYLMFLLPFLLRQLSQGRTAVQKIRLELTIIRVGLLLLAIGFTGFGLASRGWMFYAIAIGDGFGVVAMPTVRALLSRTVPNSKQGSLFAALEMLQGGAHLLSQLLIPAIYVATIGTAFPSTLAFVISGFWTLALALTAWCKSRELVSLTAEEDIDSAPGGNSNGNGNVDEDPERANPPLQPTPDHVSASQPPPPQSSSQGPAPSSASSSPRLTPSLHRRQDAYGYDDYDEEDDDDDSPGESGSILLGSRLDDGEDDRVVKLSEDILAVEANQLGIQ